MHHHQAISFYIITKNEIKNYSKTRSGWANILKESGRKPQARVIPYCLARDTPRLVGKARDARKRTPMPWTFSMTD
jgi:hypothetical protein